MLADGFAGGHSMSGQLPEDRRPPPSSFVRLFSPDPTDQAEAPDSGESEITDQNTLSDIYDRGFVPIWAEPKSLSQLTLDDYLTSLVLWRKLAPDPNGDGHEPKLSELQGLSGERIAGRFMAGLAREPGNKPGTTMS